MRIPKKIYPCPIIEAIVELRFESKIPAEAVFGVVYDKFKTEYKKVEKLPILQLPEKVRTEDPSFRFQPHYKLVDENYILQIGPNVLSLVNINKYNGWNSFSTKIKNTFIKINELDLIEKINRLGIRYINFFELNIFENINLGILLSEKPLISEQITFRSTIKTGDFLSNLQIINNGNIMLNQIQKSGSVIDIDTYIEKNGNIISDIEKLLEDGHNEEKTLFYKVLKEDFIKKLNPEY